MAMPLISIDHEKCTVPFHCKKCLIICPQQVFQVNAVKMQKFKETDPEEPGSYQLVAQYWDKCTTCNVCIEVCPEEAIEITIKETAAG